MPTLEPPGSTSGTGTGLLDRIEEEQITDTPWQAVLWNDPVNGMVYVTVTLQKILKVGKERAEHLMLLAHTDGKTAVADGTRDHCEKIVNQLMNASLWATLEKSGS